MLSSSDSGYVDSPFCSVMVTPIIAQVWKNCNSGIDVFGDFFRRSGFKHKRDNRGGGLAYVKAYQRLSFFGKKMLALSGMNLWKTRSFFSVNLTNPKNVLRIFSPNFNFHGITNIIIIK